MRQARNQKLPRITHLLQTSERERDVRACQIDDTCPIFLSDLVAGGARVRRMSDLVRDLLQFGAECLRVSNLEEEEDFCFLRKSVEQDVALDIVQL